ncbi:MAG: hypothetical protein ACOX62_03475 [Christensenellales bacterium]|jgi:ATP-dependent RNA circularization protein (DNA/RNA ligase family)
MIVKRVQSACIFQTLVFAQKPEWGFSKDRAREINREEFEHYKATLERSKVRHQIDDVTEQEDGSLVVRVRKQYNNKTDVSEYFK